jgi:hypothetical protein
LSFIATWWYFGFEPPTVSPSPTRPTLTPPQRLPFAREFSSTPETVIVLPSTGIFRTRDQA